MNTDVVLCPYCSEEIRATAIKCKHCGTLLSRVSGTAQTVDAPPGYGASPGFGGPSPVVTPGTEVREYRIVRRLGAGGMGEVYEAEHTYTGQRVAVKAVHPTLMADSSIRRRFLEEGRVMADMKHPNIVSLLAFFEEAGRFFLVMEYVEGTTLESLLEQRRLSIEEVASISVGVLSALHYAHSRPAPVVHRDIKPANIMLDPSGRPVVMDFGIAKALGREKLTRTGGAVGTYEYMSPEQVQGLDVTPASDLYSFGIVLYQMLAGTVPFPQSTEGGFDVMKAHVEAPVPMVPNHPPQIQALLARSLEKSPTRRYSSAMEMARAVEATTGSTVSQWSPSGWTTPPPARPASTPIPTGPRVAPPTLPSTKRLPLWVAGAVIGGLLVLAGVLAVAMSMKSPAEPASPSDNRTSPAIAELDSNNAPEPTKAAPESIETPTEEAPAPSPPVPSSPTVTVLTCPSCPPNHVCLEGRCVCRAECAGRVCGSDGCAGSCGTCPSGHRCEAGSCLCQPNCSNRSCGGDGCGGSCGYCASGHRCDSGACVSTVDRADRSQKALGTVTAWLQAWNARDLEAFAALLDSSYRQNNTWGSRTTVTYKNDRINEMRSLWGKADWLSVGLSEPRVDLSSDGTRATVRGVFEYRSDRYNSDGHHRVELRYSNDRWWITEENFEGIRKWR